MCKNCFTFIYYIGTYTVEFENQGNFCVILKHRSHGDAFLKNILEKTKNYKYIIPHIQNETICICDNLILKSIVKR